MARPGLMEHRKFKRLTRSLGSRAAALGSLELLWSSCYQSGDDRLGDADDVELVADWQGERGALAAALVDAGFVDRDGDLYRVHDLYDHAPDYVQKRMAREMARVTRGTTISQMRANAGKRGGEASKRKQTAATCFHEVANGVTPAPAPAPAPEEQKHAHPAGERASDPPLALVPSEPQPRFDLEALYAAYPRKEGKARGMAKAQSVIRTGVDYQRHRRAIANLVARIQRDGMERQYIPHFSTWMNGSWLDYADGIPEPTKAAPKGTTPEPAHRPDALRPLSEVLDAIPGLRR